MLKIRYFLLPLVLSLALSHALGQERADQISVKQISQPTTSTSLSKDTRRSAVPTPVLYPTADDTCSATVEIRFLTDFWGTISGMNAFGDEEKAQRLEFTGTAPYHVISTIAFFAIATPVGDGDIVMHVYDVDAATGGPGALISTTQPMKVSELALSSDTSFNATPFLFEGERSGDVPGTQFFVSVDFKDAYAKNDTVSVWQTVLDCGDGSDSWENFASSKRLLPWVPVNDSTSWRVNIDFIMAAIVDFDDPTSTDEYIASSGLRIYPASPNPARDQVQLNFELDRTREVDIEIYDVQGRYLQAFRRGVMPAGKHQHLVDVHHLSGGSYYYRIASENAQIMSRFLVQR